jgi:hypothetical protein
MNLYNFNRILIREGLDEYYEVLRRGAPNELPEKSSYSLLIFSCAVLGQACQGLVLPTKIPLKFF